MKKFEVTLLETKLTKRYGSPCGKTGIFFARNEAILGVIIANEIMQSEQGGMHYVIDKIEEIDEAKEALNLFRQKIK